MVFLLCKFFYVSLSWLDMENVHLLQDFGLPDFPRFLLNCVTLSLSHLQQLQLQIEPRFQPYGFLQSQICGAQGQPDGQCVTL